MQTALALPTVSHVSNPIIEVAQSIAATLRGGETVDAGMLRALFKSAAGLSQSNAGWLTRRCPRRSNGGRCSALS